MFTSISDLPSDFAFATFCDRFEKSLLTKALRDVFIAAGITLTAELYA